LRHQENKEKGDREDAKLAKVGLVAYGEVHDRGRGDPCLQTTEG
jgi:hypothetical protein